MDEKERIQACFCSFIEGSLITHDFEHVLDLFTEDAMGIGMGAQGIVRCREDLRPILMNTRSDVDDSQTAIQYSNMQIRYYGRRLCQHLRYCDHNDHSAGTAAQKVTFGQCASLRKIEGEWCGSIRFL